MGKERTRRATRGELVARLLVHVEGETEEKFVNEVLAPHLYENGYQSVGARLLGNARERSRRGGIRGWDGARKDIIGHLRENRDILITTMVDYYGLPRTRRRAWPGRDEAGDLPFERKASTVESALHEDICSGMDDHFNPARFIPFVMMHEFEALLFSDCSAFARGIGEPGLAQAFQAIRDQFETPEHINDSQESAPSKRVADLVPGYQKPTLGTLAALEIGLDRIRHECPHFAEWLTRLESYPVANDG